jgi:hypothetical protein
MIKLFGKAGRNIYPIFDSVGKKKYGVFDNIRKFVNRQK